MFGQALSHTGAMCISQPDFSPRNVVRSTTLAVIASILSLAAVVAGPVSAQTNIVSGAVQSVIDGDTFRLRGVDRLIWVWGLDARERNEPGARAATSALRQLIADERLTCRMRDIDRYDRIVGQCFLPDGLDITALMIAVGVATEYCRYSGGHYGTCRGN